MKQASVRPLDGRGTEVAEQSEIFVPAAAALPTVAGFRVKRGDTTPDPALVVDFGPDGISDLAAVDAGLLVWPGGSDLFAEVRFVPRG